MFFGGIKMFSFQVIKKVIAMQLSWFIVSVSAVARFVSLIKAMLEWK